MLMSASSYLGKARFDDVYYYLKHQLLYGFSIGIVGFLIASQVHYRRYRAIAFIALLVSIGLLVLVFTPFGLTANGAARWVQVGSFVFQPSEILKLTLIIYFAAWLAKSKARRTDLVKGFVPFVSVLGIISALLLFQPSTSSTVLFIAVSLTMYFVSGARLRFIAVTMLIGTIAIASVITFTGYRLDRIKSYLNPAANVEMGGYHITQAQNAIGSGGIFGVGFGKSTTKIRLPEPIGDSIFAVIAEELGFLGAITIIVAYLFLVLRIFMLSHRVSDLFGKLILSGFGTLIMFQAFVNIASISGVIPLTGMTLPFISYGGTALAVFMTMGGIIANISKYA
jgi:cell division protein FtsW